MSILIVGGNEWRVCFDAFNLEEAKKQTCIDLADLSAGGWHQVETDAGAVGRVLSVICGDEIRARNMTGRQFAKGVRGSTIEAGRTALTAEGSDFFLPSEWSEIRSNLQKRKDWTQQQRQMDLIGLDQAAKILPLAEAFTKLDELTQRQMIQQAMDGQSPMADTASEISPASPSAGGQDATRLTPATDSPDYAELTAVG